MLDNIYITIPGQYNKIHNNPAVNSIFVKHFLTPSNECLFNCMVICEANVIVVLSWTPLHWEVYNVLWPSIYIHQRDRIWQYCIALDGKGGTNELAPRRSVRTVNKALCIWELSSLFLKRSFIQSAAGILLKIMNFKDLIFFIFNFSWFPLFRDLCGDLLSWFDELHTFFYSISYSSRAYSCSTRSALSDVIN